MVNEWPRRAYGKLVQYTGGPIRGTDYTTTARSANPAFPNVGDAIAFPAVGITSQERWADYPRAWVGGGLCLRPQAADGTVYLIASRVRPYPERPDKPNSPEYVESLHAVHPVATLDFPSLFQLPDRLVPVSLTEVDKDFAPMVLDGGRAVPLPPGWFEHSRAMVVALVAGTPLDAHDYAIPAEEFFARALRAVACLPGAVRWRVPIAAGVYAVPPAEKAGVRYALALSFQSRGSSGPVADIAGEAYAQWFEEATEAGGLCATVQDVLRVVENRFPLLTAWDALPTSDHWQVAVKALAEIQQFEALKSWIRAPDGPAPGLDHFVHMKPDVLDLAAGSLDGPAVVRDALLTGVVGRDWDQVWQRFAPRPGIEPTRMAVAGQLLGMLGPLDPAALARILSEKPLELPAALHVEISSRMSSALNMAVATGGAALSAWAGLLGRAFAHRSPIWFKNWVGANTAKLVWRAVRLRFVDKGIDATTSWDSKSFPGAPAAVQALLQGRPPDESDFQKLLGELADADGIAAQRLIDELGHTNPQSAIRLALALKYDRWLADRTDPSVAAKMDDAWIQAVAAVASAQPRPDQRLAALLISAWKRVPPREWQSIRPRLRRDLGSLDSILFGDKPELTSEPVADWIWPIARKLCEGDPQPRRNVLLAACRQPELVTDAFQRHLLTPVLTSNDISLAASQASPTLEFALDIRKSRPAEFPKAQGSELAAARLWLPLLKGSPTRTPAPVLRRLDQVAIAFLYGQFLQPFPPRANRTFWAEWLQMVATSQREWYFEIVKRAGVEHEAFWRFAAGWGKIDHALSEREVEIILTNDLVEEYVRAVLQGAPFELEILSRLDLQEISNICETPAHCRNLYMYFKDVEDGPAVVAFWKNCFRHMAREEIENLYLEVNRGPMEEVLHRISSIPSKFFGHDESTGAWHDLALDIYKSSSDRVKRHLNVAIARQLKR